MKTKQTIAIIGATGSAGVAVARTLARGNYRLLLIDNLDSEMERLVRHITGETPFAELEAFECTYNACWEADIIILTIPACEQNAIAEKIREVVNQKTVINLADDSLGMLKQLLPNSKVMEPFPNGISDLEPVLSSLN